MRDHKAANPRLLGAVLDEIEQEGSVIGLRVDPLPGATLFDLGELQELLVETLGISIGVVTPGELPTRIRERVLGEAKPL